VIAANGFINFKAVYSIGADPSYPIKLSAGMGIGGQGIYYNFSQGDEEFHRGAKGYSRDKYSKSVTVIPTANLFLAAEFPVGKKFRFHGLVRAIPGFERITAFEDFPNHDLQPGGKLGGFIFVGGLEFQLG